MRERRKTVVFVGVITSFVTTFSSSALNLAIPDMSSYFHMGAASVGWIVTIYLFIIAAFSVPCGKLGDSTDRKAVLITGIAVFGITSVISVFVTDPGVFLAVRGIQALGASLIFATNMPIAINLFSPNERGKAIGLIISGTYFGLAAGPVIGGFLNARFGWKSIFVFSAVVTAIAFVLAVFKIPKPEMQDKKENPDIRGNIVFVLMLSSFIYGLTEINAMKFAWLFILASFVLGYVFVRIELRTDNPVIDVRIFASSLTFTFSNLTALFNYSATFALGYMASIYLQVVLGYSSGTAGLILITQPLLMAVLSPRMGRLSDRIQPYKMASLGMLLCSVSLLMFVFFNDRTPIWIIVISLAIAGVGIAMFSSPNTNIIMGCVPPHKFGVANSILGTMRTTGQSTGLAVITVVVSATVGDVSMYEASADALVKAVHIGFAIFTVLCVIGIFMSMQRKKL